LLEVAGIGDDGGELFEGVELVHAGSWQAKRWEVTGSLSDLEIVGCKSTAAVHFSPSF
jgi:hypothetical protein